MAETEPERDMNSEYTAPMVKIKNHEPKNPTRPGM